jgi:hypothetical protein
VCQHVEYVEEQRLCFGTVVLQEIERQGHDLTVYKRAGWEPFTGLGDVRIVL